MNDVLIFRRMTADHDTGLKEVLKRVYQYLQVYGFLRIFTEFMYCYGYTEILLEIWNY